MVVVVKGGLGLVPSYLSLKLEIKAKWRLSFDLSFLLLHNGFFTLKAFCSAIVSTKLFRASILYTEYLKWDVVTQRVRSDVGLYPTQVIIEHRPKRNLSCLNLPQSNTISPIYMEKHCPG